ncbi:MAG: type II secretion system protein [Patescibacteria group bacterium]|jgi:prepilin-type N-terminal cleavage/methylation domain-containing protein
MAHHKKGFTLIELLVVIAIIGVLSAIGLVSLNGAREKARDAQRVSDLAQMSTALVLYYDDHDHTYPEQLAQSLDAEVDCVNSDNAGFDVGFTSDGTSLTPSVVGEFMVWQKSGPIVPQYLSINLFPPGGGTGWQDLYCYDTNNAASTPQSSYIIFTGLEAGSGNGFFYINSRGFTGNTKPASLCEAQDICMP